MIDTSAGEIVGRMRRSLVKLLEWAERGQPRMLDQRQAYDADLDEAEDLIDAAEAWIVLHTDKWPRPWRRKER